MKPTFYLFGVAVVVAAIVLAVGWRWYGHHHIPTWQQVNAMIARDFPQVPQMNVHHLAVWLHDPHRKPPLLLDVRSRPEFAVSHLHDARWIDSAEPVSKALAGVSQTEPIVTYCSVGYRSSAYAQRLLQDGFTNVHDLKGSIFQWANDGLPVYRDGRIVHHVHPYNHYWGHLLKRSLWAFHP
jgi:rhodanese-related sulfurtransferase